MKLSCSPELRQLKEIFLRWCERLVSDSSGMSFFLCRKVQFSVLFAVHIIWISQSTKIHGLKVLSSANWICNFSGFTFSVNIFVLFLCCLVTIYWNYVSIPLKYFINVHAWVILKNASVVDNSFYLDGIINKGTYFM